MLALLRILTMQGIFNNKLLKADHIDRCKNDVAFSVIFSVQMLSEISPVCGQTSNFNAALLWNILDIDVDNWYSQGFLKTQN